MPDSRALPGQSTRRAAIEPAIAPGHYQMLWELALFGGLTAGEFSQSRRAYGSPRGTANGLKALVALGLVERSDDRIYSLTSAAVEWLEAPRG